MGHKGWWVLPKPGTDLGHSHILQVRLQKEEEDITLKLVALERLT